MSLSGQLYQLRCICNDMLEKDLRGGKKKPIVFCHWGSAILLKCCKSHYCHLQVGKRSLGFFFPLKVGLLWRQWKLLEAIPSPATGHCAGICKAKEGGYFFLFLKCIPTRLNYAPSTLEVLWQPFQYWRRDCTKQISLETMCGVFCCCCFLFL